MRTYTLFLRATQYGLQILLALSFRCASFQTICICQSGFSVYATCINKATYCPPVPAAFEQDRAELLRLPDGQQEGVQLQPLLLVLPRAAVARHRPRRPLAPGTTLAVTLVFVVDNTYHIH